MSRNKARIVAMQALFQLDAGRDQVDQVIDARAQEENLSEKDMKYLREIADSVSTNRIFIDDFISRYSIDWDLSRLGKVERSILRLAIGEIIYSGDVPTSVAINEAVKLSKKFGSDQAARFINGVLGKFSRENPEYSNGPEPPKNNAGN